MSSDGSYVIRASDVTTCFAINPNGDTTISGNLDVGKILAVFNSSNDWFLGRLDSTDIGCLIVYSTSASSTSWRSGVWGANTNEFNIWYAYKGLTIKPTGDALLCRNLDVGKILAKKRIPDVSDTTPLVIISDSPGGATLASYRSKAYNQGCVFEHTTAASPTAWMTGIIWGSLNEFVIWYGYNDIGLTLKSNGSAVLSGNVDVEPGQAQTSIKAYVNHAGYQGNAQIEARWRSQSFIHFDTDYPDGLL